MKLFLSVLLLSAAALAQTKPNPPALNPPVVKLDISPLVLAEKVPILTAQKNLAYKYTVYLQAQSALQKAEIDVQQSSAAVTQAWKTLLDNRHLKPEDVVQCDGPAPGPCEKVAPGDVALVPKPEVKK